jgi:hypothetical protein
MTSDAVASMMAASTTSQVPIDVRSADAEGIALTIQSGATVPLKLSVEGQTATSLMGYPSLRVLLKPTAPGSPNTLQKKAFDSDGVASLENIPPGEFRLQIAPLGPEVYVKEAWFGKTDVLRNPWKTTSGMTGTLNVVLSNKAAEVTGTVLDTHSQPTSGSTVVLIPEQRERTDLYKSAIADTTGRFLLNAIAPGNYKLFAWDALEPNAWFDRVTLSQYELQGKPIRIQESAKEVADLKVIPAVR